MLKPRLLYFFCSHISHAVVIICLTLLLFTVSAQSSPPPGEHGFTFMQTYTQIETGGAGQNFGIIQDESGIIYVANLKSVLEYDGSQWRRITHPERKRPISIDISSSGRIFIGFQNDLGFLGIDNFGQNRIVSLRSQLPDSLRNDIGYIWGVKCIRDVVYFRSPNRLYRWQPYVAESNTGKMDFWDFPRTGKLLGLSNIDGRCLFWQQDVGLMELNGDSCQIVPGGEFLANIPVRSISKFDENTLILACEDNGLYLFKDNRARKFESDASSFAEDNFAIGCLKLADDYFALSTRFGGVLFFDSKGRIDKIIDQDIGLLDNNVLASPFLDNQGGIWLALNYGIARIEALSPVEYFDYDLGISGSIHDITRFQNTIYAATSQGLRYLTPSPDPGKPASFEIVEGIEDRCWALEPVHNELLCVTTRGLEIIREAGSKPELIRSIGMGYCLAVSPDSQRIYLGTYGEGVYVFQRNRGLWKYLGAIPGTSRQVLLIQPDINGNLWLMAAYRHVEKVHFSDPESGDIKDVSVKIYDTSKGLPELAHYYPVILDDQLFVGNPSGLFKYNSSTDLFQPDSSLGHQFGSGQRGIWNMTRDSKGRVWFDSQFAKGACVSPGETGDYELNYPLLRASQASLLCFYPDEANSILWAGGENGRLIRYDEKFELPEAQKYNALIRKVTADESTVLVNGIFPPSWETPRLPYEKNSLRFEYSIPRYDAPNTNKFQYRLIGLDDSWSAWTNESYRDFTSLHEGLYRFEVRGYDVYYSESEIEAFEFQIAPPWYRTTWAFIFYVGIIYAVIYILVKLRLRRVEIQKRELENIVALRTKELEKAHTEIKDYSEHLELILEERTRHLILSERQAVFGQLVQGIVHNLRNPLTSSSMSTELIRRAIEKSESKEFKSGEDKEVVREAMVETVEKSVKWIEKANRTLNRMIDTLLTKSRSDKGEDKKVVNVNSLIQTELDFLEADSFFKNRVTKQVELASEELLVKVVPGELSQVFQNLIRNALDAMFETEFPTFLIKTYRKHSSVIIVFKDNGPGIPENIMNKIFDPFFTTKPAVGSEDADPSAPKGTGLGLWMCNEAIESFNGKIRVNSENTGETGTTFTIILPLSNEKYSPDQTN